MATNHTLLHFASNHTDVFGDVMSGLHDHNIKEVSMNADKIDMDVLYEDYYASPMAIQAYRKLNTDTTTTTTTTPTTGTTSTTTTTGTITVPGTTTGTSTTTHTTGTTGKKPCTNADGELIDPCETEAELEEEHHDTSDQDILFFLFFCMFVG